MTIAMGVQFEVMFVDPRSGGRVPVGPQVLELVGLPGAGFSYGPTYSALRYRSPLFLRPEALEAQLEEARAQVAQAAELVGAEARLLPLHPWAPAERLLAAPELAGRSLLGRQGWFHHQAMTTELTLVVEGLAPQPVEALAFDAPLLLALSTGSPVWAGQSTGFASSRSAIRHGDVAADGAVDWPEPPRDSLWQAPLEARDLSLDLTWLQAGRRIEYRLADLPGRTEEIAALAALAAAFACAPVPGLVLTSGQWNRNLWRCARDGVHALLELPGQSRRVPAHEVLVSRINALECLVPARSRAVLGRMLARRRVLSVHPPGDQPSEVRA